MCMMKKKLLFIPIMLCAMLSASSVFVSCVNNQDLYDAEANSGKDFSKIFSFSTIQKTKLNINYGFNNYKINFKVYDVNPLDSANKDKQPIFAGCTDNKGSFSNEIEMPASVSKIYLCSNALGVPSNIELTVTNGVASYNKTFVTSRNIAHSESCVNIGSSLYSVYGETNLYCLYNQYNHSYWYDDDNWVPSNTKVAGLYSVLNDAQLGDFYTRVDKALRWNEKTQRHGKIDNSAHITTTEHVNTTIALKTVAGEKVDNAHVDLVFLDANGSYQNAMAYYYYPSDMNPNEITANYIKNLPKFFVFPRSTQGPMPSVKIKARLQFFGRDYSYEKGVDDFPAGYTIGYMLVPDLYNYDTYPWTTRSGYYTNNEYLSTINYKIYYNVYYDKAIYSNQVANKNQNPGCITWTDETTKRVVIGFEDQAYKKKDNSGRIGDNSYEDILFYVDADPIAAIYDPERPTIPDTKPVVEDQTFTREGTYAFEDIWPNGGDYDMNDVVVEWKTVTTTNDNKVKKIEDTFKVVQKPGAATKKNAFGFVINDNYGGTVTSNAPQLTKEENNQYILFENALNEIGKSYTFTRTFAEGAYPTFTGNERNYNIFIVPDYEKGQKGRIEVHLPKVTATDWASSKFGSGENAFYVNAEGKYPFAIYLDGIVNFEQVSERVKIGSANEYPHFNNWVESLGQKYADWYLSKK